jgi:hypothetical protein
MIIENNIEYFNLSCLVTINEYITYFIKENSQNFFLY